MILANLTLSKYPSDLRISEPKFATVQPHSSVWGWKQHFPKRREPEYHSGYQHGSGLSD
jgi:hypothetical protein